MHRTFAFFAAIVLTTISVTTAGFASGPERLQFSLEPSRSVDRLQLSLRHGSNGRNSNWSSTTAVSELRGLDVARLRSGGTAPLTFVLVREAGRFDCSGHGGQSSARGECRFTADPGFADYLVRRGIARPNRDQAYALAMSGVGRAHVEALAANRYPLPTVNQLVAMGIHGATPRFIQDLAATGYRLQSAKDLVAFRIHGVDADYIRSVTAAAPQLGRLTAGDLVAFRIHRVSPNLVRTYARLGRGRLDRKDVVAMAIHGVTPEFIEELSRLGYRDVAAGDLVQMRIFGVTPQYIRSLQRDGAGRIPVAELVQMRIMGNRRRTR
ncbi:MAG TPA: hypothetical protein VMN38_02835 [Sphingomicrobium sp.]|nr:hypothetical protein [Sphingomicrobium sp.]